MVNAFIVSVVIGQHRPATATAHHVEDGINDLSQLQGWPTRSVSLFLSRWQELAELVPLFLTEFVRVLFDVFASFVSWHRP